jgi:hypothetical protein
VIRLGLRYKFIFTLLGFTLIVAVPLGILAIMRFSDVLESQVARAMETIVKFWGPAAFQVAQPSLCQRVLQAFATKV